MATLPVRLERGSNVMFLFFFSEFTLSYVRFREKKSDDDDVFHDTREKFLSFSLFYESTRVLQNLRARTLTSARTRTIAMTFFLKHVIYSREV